MSFQGHIENGVVVLDEPVSLPNGTVVRVEPVEGTKEKAESSGPVSADTDRPHTMQEMAQAWKTVAKPISAEDVPISVDPDETPRAVPGRGKGMLTIIAEDDDHLKDFAEYMP